MAAVKQLLHDSSIGVTGSSIAGITVEPIQAEGGDNHATNGFFRRLRQLALDFKVCFIVDEVQTGGGATGKMWAHDYWGLSTAPDIVVFAKKCQIAGYFSVPALKPDQGYRIFNTWMGDPAKLLMLEVILDEYKKKDLVQKVADTGEYLLEGLHAVAKKYPNVISRVRGKGTFAAWSLKDPATRDAMVFALRQKGALTGGCGPDSIRLRPTMVFEKHHAEQFLALFEEVVKDMQ